MQIIAKYRPNTKTHAHPILPGLLLLTEVTNKQTERCHNSNCQKRGSHFTAIKILHWNTDGWNIQLISPTLPSSCVQ